MLYARPSLSLTASARSPPALQIRAVAQAWVRMLQLQAAHGMAGAMGAMGANGMGGQHAGGQMRHMGAPQLGGASGAGALGAYGGAVSGVAAGCLDAQMHVAMAREHQAQMQQQWLASLQTQSARRA